LSPFPFFPAGDFAALPFGVFGTRTFFFFLATPSVAIAVAASAGFCFALALFGVFGFLLFSLAMVVPHLRARQMWIKNRRRRPIIFPARRQFS
jgi:hypothetical protein